MCNMRYENMRYDIRSCLFYSVQVPSVINTAKIDSKSLQSEQISLRVKVTVFKHACRQKI